MVFDNVVHPALLKAAGDGQEGAPGDTLRFVVEAMDERGEPMVDKTVQFDILAGGGRLSAQIASTDTRGRAQITLTLGAAAGINKVKASSEGIQSYVLFTAVGTGAAPQVEPAYVDVNGDGKVDWKDLVAVAENYGLLVESVGGLTADASADVNGDGVVDVIDVLAVIVGIADEDAAAGAPALTQADIEPGSLRAADVRRWLRDAKAANAEPAGIAALARLLAALMRAEAPPSETVLLANYPNPFNPETWIPYQLANPAEVTVTLYAANGAVVRTLDLGHRRAGRYASRSRAAYWDGRNAAGEPVASGVYFYTLRAGGFSATRRMVIRK